MLNFFVFLCIKFICIYVLNSSKPMVDLFLCFSQHYVKQDYKIKKHFPPVVQCHVHDLVFHKNDDGCHVEASTYTPQIWIICLFIYFYSVNLHTVTVSSFYTFACH